MASQIANTLGKRFISWFSQVQFLDRLRTELDLMIDFYYRSGSNGKLILTYPDNYRKMILNKIKLISKETAMLLHYDEAYRIFMAVKNTKK